MTKATNEVYIIHYEDVDPTDKRTDAEIVGACYKFDKVRAIIEDEVSEVHWYDIDQHFLDFQDIRELNNSWDECHVFIRTHLGKFVVGRYTVSLKYIR